MDDAIGIKRITGPTILLASGSYFDFEAPEQTPVTIEDVARGLSHICRFTGQCRRFYSVAEHSVLVSYAVPRRDAFAALMHDAAEAVMGDVSRPLKSLLPDYKRLEARVEAAIMASFGLPAELPPSIKLADMQMLAVEQAAVMGNRDDWGISPERGLSPEIRFWTPEQAMLAFMNRYDEVRTNG